MKILPYTEFDLIEQSFQTIAETATTWQRLILLDKLPSSFGLTRSGFRRAFEAWLVLRQGGTDEN